MDNLDNTISDPFKILPLFIKEDKNFKTPILKQITIKQDFSIKIGMFVFVRKDKPDYCLISDNPPNGVGGNYGYFPPIEGRGFNIKTSIAKKICNNFNKNKINIVTNIS